MSHANAPLTATGRLRLARCVVEDGWTRVRAAERFTVSVNTVRKWVNRYREHGKEGMSDCSSRPHHSPGQTPRKRERRVLGLRVSRRWGPARIAYHLGMQPSTVHKILSRYGCVRLSFTDPATGAPIRAAKRRPRRYEHAAPGDLVHVDIKKLGRIPDGGGHKVHGRARGKRNRTRGMGYWYIHNAVDDHSRLAYSELLEDERKDTAAGFWRRASDFFNHAGITVRRVLTDNGSCYRSHAFADALGSEVTHKRTRPYRPQTNGKVERYNRILLEEWAYARPYRNERHRAERLPAFLHHYNHHRGHTALRGATPADRVHNLRGQNSYPSALRGPRGPRLQRATRRDLPGQGVRDLAVRSIPLRSGLTKDAARRTCELIRPMLSGDAVSITDTEEILAFIGPGEDHHLAGGEMQTLAAPRAIRKGKTQVVRDRDGVGCREPGCEVTSAVVAPLRIGQRVVGTLGDYQNQTEIPPKQLVEDMANMLSLHLELAELDRERQLAASARLDALRAQINPHFLFNILNTIASKARTRPDEARELLLRLSEFFRYAVRQEGHLAEFAQEYYFVRTYLSLEQARFGDRLSVRYDIDPQVLTSRVPVLTIQPLVENAVKHGIAGKKEGGTFRLRARVDPLTRTTSIKVSDDGVGMDPETLQHPDPLADTHVGVGLKNISERLESLFGDCYSLSISTPKSGGTVVELTLPLR